MQRNCRNEKRHRKHALNDFKRVTVYGIFKVVSAIIFFLSPLFSYADEVTLKWDSCNPQPTTYRIYQRTDDQAYNYENPIKPFGLDSADIPPEINQATIKNLTASPGTKVNYFWIIRAIDGAIISGDSNEVKYTVDRSSLQTKHIKITISN